MFIKYNNFRYTKKYLDDGRKIKIHKLSFLGYKKNILKIINFYYYLLKIE